MQVNQIITGDCLEVMKDWPDNSVDAIVTDIPYGIGFMGKEWDTFKQENMGRPKAYKLTYKTDFKDGVPVKRKKPEMVTRDSGARRAGSYDLSRNAEYQEWCRIWSKEALRIAKPGAFLMCFGGTRTYHRVTCGLEDAGWQIRDCMMWLYGSGFPKSHNISKAIDKAKGAYKKGKLSPNSRQSGASPSGCYGEGVQTKTIDEPQTDFAKLWDGYGTALKPAWEPIIVAMKPLDGTFAQNAETHGVAGLNIDGGRIGTDELKSQQRGSPVFQETSPGLKTGWNKEDYNGEYQPNTQGRWPANVILDEEAGAMLDEQSETSTTGNRKNKNRIQQDIANTPFTRGQNAPEYTDSGGASRFFYCAKASRSERNAGLKGMAEKQMYKCDNSPNSLEIFGTTDGGRKPRQNHHPTVKPLKLMEYLCTLLKLPTGGILLDCFGGSGSTAVACINTGWDYIIIEKEAEYCEIARKRVEWAVKQKQKNLTLFGKKSCIVPEPTVELANDNLFKEQAQ